MSKKKLLWLSDSPRIEFVGQSIVTRECLSRLQEDFIVESLGFGDADIKTPISVPYNVIPCKRQDMNNPDTVVELIKKSNPDVLLFSHDPWLLPSIGIIRSKLPTVKLLGWLTIDGEPPYYRFYDMIKPYHKVITPTVFCEKCITDRWLDINCSTVPYGIDHSIFHAPKQGKEIFKQQIHQESQGIMPLANRFFAFYAGANQDRKNLGLAHEAWRKFEKGKESSVIFVMFTHSASLKEEIGTYDLSVFVHDTQTLVVNAYPQPTKAIGQLMAAADVLFHPSTGEGFGLTPLEAQACGTVPVILPYAGVTDFCTEENSYHIPYTTFCGGYHVHRAIASVDDTVKQLELAYNNKELRAAKSAKAIETAQAYTWERTAEMLKQNINEVIEMPLNSVGLKRLA